MTKLVPSREPPRIPLDMLQWLEALYPPRCKTITEPVEAHMLYAGAVAATQMLRKHYDAQQERLKAIATGAADADASSPSRPRGKPSTPRSINT